MKKERIDASRSIEIIEKELKTISGMGMLIVTIIGLILSICSIVLGAMIFMSVFVFIGIAGTIIFPILMGGLKVVNPNEALVLTLFGKYYGTIKKDGFFFVNPFSTGFNPTAQGMMEQIEDMTQGTKKKSSGGNKNKGKKVSTKTMTLNNPQQKVNVFRVIQLLSAQ